MLPNRKLAFNKVIFKFLKIAIDCHFKPYHNKKAPLFFYSILQFALTFNGIKGFF